MRVCFTSDLHGRADLYEQLDKLVADRRPELLILGGDLCSDADVDDPIGSQVAYFAEDLQPRIERWLQQHSALHVALIPGNHEWLPTAHAIAKFSESPRVHYPRLKPIDCDSFALVGFAMTPPTPYHAKDFERLDHDDDHVNGEEAYYWDADAGAVRQTTAREYFSTRRTIAETLADFSKPAKPWIFVCHAPPRDTALDRLPDISFPVGSAAVRKCIETHQPLVSLHGHIHDSPAVTGAFFEKMSGSLAINPGQGEEELYAVIFDSEHPERGLRHSVFG